MIKMKKKEGFMKNFVGFILALVILTSIVFAAKVETFDRLSNIKGEIRYNVKVRNVTSSSWEYVPAIIKHKASGKSNEGSYKPVEDIIRIGEVSNTTLEGRDLHQALPAYLRKPVKNLYLELDEDVSQ
jgi:hypothetical protein